MLKKEIIEKGLEQLDDIQQEVLRPLILHFEELEKRADELRALPQIRVSKKNPTAQETTAAGRQYIATIQQLNNIAKTICGSLGKAEGEELSPIRAYFAQLNK